MFAHIQHGGHKPEVVIPSIYGILKNREKSYFIASAHDRSHSMYSNNVRQLPYINKIHTVLRITVHTNEFWSNVTICNNSGVITTSGFVAMLILMV